jgi:hypothetical protein
MPWWGWIVIGMLLLGAELFVEAEFFLVFIGVSALVTGLVAVAAPGLPEWSHWLVFAAVAVASMVFFRRRLYRALRPQNVPGLKPAFLGDEIDVPVALAAGGTCRVELHGTTWQLRNTGVAPVAAGGRVRVVAVEGVELRVERAGE